MNPDVEEGIPAEWFGFGMIALVILVAVWVYAWPGIKKWYINTKGIKGAYYKYIAKPVYWQFRSRYEKNTGRCYDLRNRR